MTELQSSIEKLSDQTSIRDIAAARELFANFRAALTAGEIRAAEKITSGRMPAAGAPMRGSSKASS